MTNKEKYHARLSSRYCQLKKMIMESSQPDYIHREFKDVSEQLDLIIYGPVIDDLIQRAYGRK